MLLLTFVLLLAGAGTGDWPRFRGPDGTGIQETGRLPAELSAARNVAWKTALPSGYSSPVVSGDRIFVTASEGEKLLTIALDRRSGASSSISTRTARPILFTGEMDDEVYATPAIAFGRVSIRTRGALYSFGS